MTRWHVANNAGLRPALFFELTHLSLDPVYRRVQAMAHIFENPRQIQDQLIRAIYEVIDTFFTPFVIQEIHCQSKRLSGKTPRERYADFFLTSDQKWQRGAVRIEQKYAKQLACLRQLMICEIRAFDTFLRRLNRDFNKIGLFFFGKPNRICHLDFSFSDRHNFQGTVIIVSFCNGNKVVYKPKSAQSDLLLARIFKTVFPESKCPCLPRILPGATYHWAEYIQQSKFNKINEFKKLYYHFGLLLSVCDMLNYSDGHAENFVVAQNYHFVPIDTETLFTNLSYFATKITTYFDLEFTGLIPAQDKSVPYQPLLRAKNQLSYFPYMPYIEHDNTDRISFDYRQLLKNKADKSFPAQRAIPLNKFLPDMISGLQEGYTLIRQKTPDLLVLLKKSNLPARQIIRPTLYYVWLISKYLHPANKKFAHFLTENTENINPEIAAYEKQFIPYGNIPVFYNRLHSRHLYDRHRQIVVPNYFRHTSYFWIKRKVNSLQNQEFIEQRIKQLSLALQG